MATWIDFSIASVGATQALVLGYLAYRSSQNGKKASSVQDTLDTQVTTSLLAVQTAVQGVTAEVFAARQDHTALSEKIDEVHAQVHELRGDLAFVAEQVQQGTSGPVR